MYGYPKVLSAELAARAQPDEAESWHRLRRRLRRLRHQSALLTGSSPMLASPRYGEEVLAALAHAQDESVLLALCAEGSPFPPAPRRALRAWLAARQRQARSAAMRAAAAGPLP
jgi:hypothetical protein